MVVLKYARELKFEEEPNYSFIRDKLRKLFDSSNFKYDLKFDWMLHNSNEEKKHLLHLDNQDNKCEENLNEKKIERENENANLRPNGTLDNSIEVNPTSNPHELSRENTDHANGNIEYNEISAPAPPLVKTEQTKDTKKKNSQPRDEKKCGYDTLVSRKDDEMHDLGFVTVLHFIAWWKNSIICSFFPRS